MFETDPKYADLLLTSIMKGMKAGVDDGRQGMRQRRSSTTPPYVGTLENDGVGLAPFHNFEDKVDPALQGELDAIKADIISGTIKVESPVRRRSRARVVTTAWVGEAGTLASPARSIGKLTHPVLRHGGSTMVTT